MTTAPFAPKTILSSRIFGEYSRYRVDTFLTRDNTIEFFLLDVEAGKAGTPAVTGQADTITKCLAVLPDKGQEFLTNRPSKKGQMAVNLEKTVVKVISVKADHCLVECLGTKQRWNAAWDKLTLL